MFLTLAAAVVMGLLAVSREPPQDGLHAISTLQEYGISQMPVSEDAEGDAVAVLVGSISEKAPWTGTRRSSSGPSKR